ncbi:Putative LOC100898192, partial [Caligus rogercresseyi]
ELKEASLKNPQQTTRSTISTAISNSNEATIAQLPTLSNIARSVRGWKTINEKFPTFPQSRIGFSIPPRFKTLENSEDNFLLYDSGEEDQSRILIFGTNSGLQDLTNNRKWAIDGTFKITPDFFYQIVTVHIYIETSIA